MLKEFFKVLVRSIYANVTIRLALAGECKKLGIKIPRVILGRAIPAHLGINRSGKMIFINISVNSKKEWMNTLRHELRHSWQKKYYKKLYYWCAKKPEYKELGAFYRYCPIEMDARYYASNPDDIKGLIHLFDIDSLEQMYQEGTLLDYLMDISDYYNVPQE